MICTWMPDWLLCNALNLPPLWNMHMARYEPQPTPLQSFHIHFHNIKALQVSNPIRAESRCWAASKLHHAGSLR